MSRPLSEVVSHRKLLAARIAMQRATLAVRWQRLDTPLLRMADTGFRVSRAWRGRPLLLVAATTLLLAARRHPALFWAGRLFTFWELYRTVRREWGRSARARDTD